MEASRTIFLFLVSLVGAAWWGGWFMICEIEESAGVGIDLPACLPACRAFVDSRLQVVVVVDVRRSG